VAYRSLEKQPKIWRNVRSLAVAARLGQAIRLNREFFITIGGPQEADRGSAADLGADQGGPPGVRPTNARPMGTPWQSRRG
jgi:hypothetical protein